MNAKYFLVTTFFSVILFSSIRCQTWQKILGSGDTYYPVGISKSSGGNFYLYGAKATGTTSDGFIFKVDSLGNILSTQAYQNSTIMGVSDLSPTEIFVTSSLNFFKVTGNVISYVKNSIFGEMAKLGNDIIITAPLSRINPLTGDTVWVRKFQANSSMGIQPASILHVAPLSDGTFAGSGMIWEGVLLSRFNANGDTIWSRHYHQLGFNLSHVTELNGGALLWGSTPYFNSAPILHKFDVSGNCQWSMLLGMPGYTSFQLQKMVSTPDGGAFIGVTIGGPGISGTDFGLVKISSSGTVQWAKSYGSTFTEDLIDIALVNNHVILIGTTNGFSSAGAPIYMVKTDLNGNSGCNEVTIPVTGTLTSYSFDSGLIVSKGGSYASGSISPTTMSTASSTLCSAISVPEYLKSSEVSIYPNPAFDQIHVKGYSGNVSVFNALSEEVLKGNSADINISSLTPGIYFVKIFLRDREVVFKLVKE